MAADAARAGAGLEQEKDLYAVLGVSRGATLEQVREAYFERALLSHPDLAEPGDELRARETFRKLAQAFWVLTDPVRRKQYDHHGWADMGGFSPDAAHEALLRDGVLGGPRALDALVEGELQMQTPEECFQRFAEAVVEPIGQIPGERWRCELCSFQVRGRDHILTHLAKAHWAEAEAWAGRGLSHAKASFLSFLKAAASLGPGSFALPGGSQARLPPARLPPDLWRSSGDELERSLLFDDPCGAEAVAGALEAISPAAQDVVMQLHELSTGVGAYLAPLEGLDPNLAAPFEPELLSIRAPGQAAGAPVERQDAAWPAGGELACRCGFTCGTAAALARHLDRFAGDPAHGRLAP